LPQAKFIYTLSPDTVEANAQTDEKLPLYSGSDLLAGDLTTEWNVTSRYLVWDDKNTMSTTLSSDTDVTGGLSIDLSQLFTKEYKTETVGEGEEATVKSVLTPIADGTVKDIKSGVYRFTLQESLYTDGKTYKENIAGNYDDERTYRVDLYVQGSTQPVAGDEDKGIKAVDGSSAYVYLVKVYEYVDPVKNDKGEVVTAGYWGKANPTFNNSIEVEDLVIKNYTENNVTAEDPPFKIALQILPGSDVEKGVTLEKGTNLHAYINRYDDKTKTYTKEYVDVKVNSDDPNSTDYVTYVTLYSGDELVVPGVPVYMHYTTWNADAGSKTTNTDYYKRVQVVTGYTNDTDKVDKSEPAEAARSSFPDAATLDKDGNETGYKVQAADIVFGQNMVIYYNVNNAIAETGIAMESAPYVVMFLAAAAIAVLTVVKKKTDR
jgi:hypothetical protein